MKTNQLKYLIISLFLNNAKSLIFATPNTTITHQQTHQVKKIPPYKALFDLDNNLNNFNPKIELNLLISTLMPLVNSMNENDEVYFKVNNNTLTKNFQLKKLGDVIQITEGINIDDNHVLNNSDLLIDIQLTEHNAFTLYNLRSDNIINALKAYAHDNKHSQNVFKGENNLFLAYDLNNTEHIFYISNNENNKNIKALIKLDQGFFQKIKKSYSTILATVVSVFTVAFVILTYFQSERHHKEDLAIKCE